VAGKTGTTNDHTDAWFLGFSTRIACGVWVGLDARRTLYPGADGAKVALPIWVAFMKTALAGTPREAFPAPEGMEWVEMDRVTGLVASGATQPGDRVRLAFKPGTAPRTPCTGEALAAMRTAQETAGSRGVDVRRWGARVVPPAAEAGEPAELQPAELKMQALCLQLW
jgi:penicillin-binding protein 1A